LPIIVKFGDVFRFNEQEFVFLAQTADITYAAKILNPEHTDQVMRLYQTRVKSNPKVNYKSNVLYSFVVLDTPEFKDRMAHFKDTDKNGLAESIEVIGKLNKTDLKGIREEILHQDSAVPMKLKELLKDIAL